MYYCTTLIKTGHFNKNKLTLTIISLTIITLYIQGDFKKEKYFFVTSIKMENSGTIIKGEIAFLLKELKN